VCGAIFDVGLSSKKKKIDREREREGVEREGRREELLGRARPRGKIRFTRALSGGLTDFMRDA